MLCKVDPISIACCLGIFCIFPTWAVVSQDIVVGLAERWGYKKAIKLVGHLLTATATYDICPRTCD